MQLTSLADSRIVAFWHLSTVERENGGVFLGTSDASFHRGNKYADCSNSAGSKMLRPGFCSSLFERSLCRDLHNDDDGNHLTRVTVYRKLTHWSLDIIRVRH
jgi:hypothetical protein